MRNIAVLEWGPASLYYILPREKIKVRTEWLEGGPTMPPFLMSVEEAKVGECELSVRYALSAFEDLNSCIRNLRKCFGFPYQEYIGYLNTLTKTHRARREHEALLPGLRRWAIFGNVDAVVWIDYEKSNQPAGSFKVGPRDSRPFNRVHMELCSSVVGAQGRAKKVKDDASEADWSEHDGPEEKHQSTGGHGGHELAPSASLRSLRWGAPDAYESSRRSSRHSGAGGDVHYRPLRRRVVVTGEDGTALDRPQNSVSTWSLGSSGRCGGAAPSGRSPQSARGASQDRGPYRTALQEEFIPAHGSIYQRSIAPGPGYYGIGALVSEPASTTTSQTLSGPSFGPKQRSVIEDAVALVKEFPGPGEYEPKPSLAETTAPESRGRAKFGSFNRAVKMVSPLDAARKLPFISHMASASEGFGKSSPNHFYSVSPALHQPKSHADPLKQLSTFGSLRRPF